MCAGMIGLFDGYPCFDTVNALMYTK